MNRNTEYNPETCMVRTGRRSWLRTCVAGGPGLVASGQGRLLPCNFTALISRITLLLLVICNMQLGAQTPPLPLDAYGVWIRGDIEDGTSFDGFRGVRANYFWKDIQPNDSLHFNWTELENTLKKAYEKGLYVYTSVITGPDSPGWIYDNGVPKVVTSDTDKWPYFPYYLDADYKRYLSRMLAEFGNFVRSQPAYLTDRLAFVQVTIGPTGDVGLYKGTPIDPAYNISESQQTDFYIWGIEQYMIPFNEGDHGKKIPLVINANAIDPIDDPLAWEWVNNNIDPKVGFGIKGSAFMRGHHLTLEKQYIDTWETYLKNAKGMQLFSRGEMDQTHEMMPLYHINKPLNFYWAMISGLNTSLSVWDITVSAIAYAATAPKVHEVFRFFNKHAPQVIPSSARSAYVIFHEGLNAENTVKFPVETYGPADRGNLSRYTEICNAYASRGAKMDHLEAAPEGQVWQRHNQTGFNDAGWSIEEGNYERWIQQIDPDETSIGLFRVNGIIDANSSIYDRFARSFEHASGKDTMYFQFHEDLFSESDPEKLNFIITWLDKTASSSWGFYYEKGEGSLTPARMFTGTGSGAWETDTIEITDAVVNRSGPGGSDFALVNTDALDDIFHGIEVDIDRVGDDLDSVVISSPKAGNEFPLGDAITVTAAGFDLQGIERMRFRIDNQYEFNDDFTAPYEHTYAGLTLGEHRFDVQMKDSIGYWTDAEPVTIRVVPASDTVFIESPPEGASILLGKKVLVKAFAYDKEGIDYLGFRVDGGEYFTVDTEPYEYAFSGLGEGSHTFEVQMTDLFGNAILSEAAIVSVVDKVDSVSILTPMDGDTVLLGETVRVTTYCFDKDGIERIRFRLDNADNWDNVLAPPYEKSYSGLKIGKHLIEVQMKDLNGDRTWAESVHITVVEPPMPDSVSIISPANGASFPPGSDVLVTAYCFANEKIEVVGFRVDGGDFYNVSDPPYEYTFTGLNEGTYSFEVQMTDLLGNSILSQAVEVTILAPDSIVINSLVEDDTIALGEDVLITAAAFDNEGIEKVGFRVDGGDFNELLNPPYEFTFTGLDTGTHAFQAKMTDLSGNQLLSEEVLVYVVDPTIGFGKMKRIIDLRVYPTMVDKMFYWRSNTEIEKIHIFNPEGKKLLSLNIDGQGSLGLSDWDPGIYFVFFEFDNQSREVRKIVKN